MFIKYISRRTIKHFKMRRYCLLILLVLIYCHRSGGSESCQSSTYGTEFYFGVLELADSCCHNKWNKVVIDITNVSDNTTDVQVQIPFLSLNQHLTIRPESRRTLDVDPTIQTGRTFVERRGIRITSTKPIGVMVTNAFNSDYTIDSYNVLPLDAVRKDYVISSYTNMNTNRGSEVLVAGIHSDTNVTLLNDTDVLYETILQPFDIFQYRSDRIQHIDLTGCRVQASKDVFVVAGAAYINIPAFQYGQDHIASELYPVESMSKTFIVPPILPKQLYMVRVQSDQLSLVNIFNGSSPLYPSPAPFYTNSTQTDYIFGTKPIVILADEPVSVAQYGVSSYADKVGDPFMAMVPSIDQYVNDVKFSVPDEVYAAKPYISVIVPKAHAHELQLDSKNVLNDVINVTQINVPAPFDNYTVLSFSTSSGFHHMTHPADDVTFCVLVLGIGYELSLGYYAGYSLQGICLKPEPTVSSVTTLKHGIHFGNDQWCYNCEDMTHIELCDTVKLCSNTQTCYVASEHLSGRLVYRTGCLEKLTCQQLSNSTSNVCIECCDGSFCNSKGCGDKGLPDRIHRGPVCFDCQQVLSPEECTTVTMCEPHQVCGIEEYPWADDSFYKMGCSNKLCDRLHRSTPSCKTCCNEDYCNFNCTKRLGGVGPNVLIG